VTATWDGPPFPPPARVRRAHRPPVAARDVETALRVWSAAYDAAVRADSFDRVSVAMRVALETTLAPAGLADRAAAIVLEAAAVEGEPALTGQRLRDLAADIRAGIR